MRSAVRRAVASAALVALAIHGGCAVTPTLTVDSLDEPWRCRTVAWMELTDRAASLEERRVRAEVMRGLMDRGYMVDEVYPDCLVTGVVYTGARPGAPVNMGLGAGRWGGGFGGSIGVSLPIGGATRTHGNLAIDFIDLALNAQVWRGTLEAAFPTSEPDPAQIKAAVDQVLTGVPAPRFADAAR